jgi:hypothetical protein
MQRSILPVHVRFLSRPAVQSGADDRAVTHRISLGPERGHPLPGNTAADVKWRAE